MISIIIIIIITIIINKTYFECGAGRLRAGAGIHIM